MKNIKLESWELESIKTNDHNKYKLLDNCLIVLEFTPEHTSSNGIIYADNFNNKDEIMCKLIELFIEDGRAHLDCRDLMVIKKKNLKKCINKYDELDYYLAQDYCEFSIDEEEIEEFYNKNEK
jgi:hypothetical protein